MDTLEELYNETKKTNIMNNDDFLNMILDKYKEIERRYLSVFDIQRGRMASSELYDTLVESDKRGPLKRNLKDSEDFSIYMTNIWIKNILSLSEEQLNKLANNGCEEYYKIYNYLKNNSSSGSVKSNEDILRLYEELNSLFSNDIDYIERKRMFWKQSQEGTGLNPSVDYNGDFYHINSRYLKARQEKNEDDQYRFYINCQNEDIFKIVKKYVEYCNEKGMHFYFKYMFSDKRKDKIVIFSAKERILDNINILRQIEKDYPNIIKKYEPLPDLVDKIDGWFGFASEPNNKKLGTHYSFNTLRAEILEDAAEKITLDFVTSNINDPDIKNELIKSIVKCIIGSNNLKKDEYSNTFIKNITTGLFSPNINSSPIMLSINELYRTLPLKNSIKHRDVTKPIFEITLPNNQKYPFTIESIDKVIKTMVDTMKSKDPHYLTKYRNEIKRRCSNYDIDSDNFAFNKDTLNEFKEIDAKKQNVSKSKFKDNDGINSVISYIRKQLSLYSNDILKSKITIQSPFGVSVSLRQYAEEYISSNTDKNLIFTDSNGNRVRVGEYIKYLANEIKRSKETIKRDNFMFLSGVLSMMPKEKRKQKITIPSQGINNISLEQYVQEYLPSHMDEDNNYISETGEIISVAEYINGLVLNTLNEEKEETNNMNL